MITESSAARLNIREHLLASVDGACPVRDIRLGMFHTAVVSRHCGLAATLPRDALRQTPPMVRVPGQLLQWSAGEVARLALSSSILEAAMGMAAINSLLEVDETACLELNAAELILQKGIGRAVAIVGHFPFLPRIRAAVRECWVLEKNPRMDDLPADKAGDYLPRADVVAITGTSLTNHTLDELLLLCRPDAYVILLGDTAPLSPILFEYGIAAVCGTRVADVELALSCVSQGATFRQIRGVRRLTLLNPRRN